MVGYDILILFQFLFGLIIMTVMKYELFLFLNDSRCSYNDGIFACTKIFLS